MNTDSWPHEKIHTGALRYIRAHTVDESAWRFTCLDALPERLGRIIRLDEPEQAIVSCFIDGLNWYVMTTTRTFGLFRGSQFTCSPLEVRRWKWGNFKGGGRTQVEEATLALANGTHMKLLYETGEASMAPMYCVRFWDTEYPALEKRV